MFEFCSISELYFGLLLLLFANLERRIKRMRYFIITQSCNYPFYLSSPPLPFLSSPSPLCIFYKCSICRAAEMQASVFICRRLLSEIRVYRCYRRSAIPRALRIIFARRNQPLFSECTSISARSRACIGAKNTRCAQSAGTRVRA